MQGIFSHQICISYFLYPLWQNSSLYNLSIKNSNTFFSWIYVLKSKCIKFVDKNSSFWSKKFEYFFHNATNIAIKNVFKFNLAPKLKIMLLFRKELLYLSPSGPILLILFIKEIKILCGDFWIFIKRKRKNINVSEMKEFLPFATLGLLLIEAFFFEDLWDIFPLFTSYQWNIGKNKLIFLKDDKKSYLSRPIQLFSH